MKRKQYFLARIVSDLSPPKKGEEKLRRLFSFLSL